MAGSLPIGFAAILFGGWLLSKGSVLMKTAFAASGTLTGGSSTVEGSAGSPATLPYGVALTGANAERWADAILTALGAPLTKVNVESMEAWFEHEGGGGQNNPMNTTLQTSGVTGSFGVGVKDYATPAEGVQATADTLADGYPAIVSALQSGDGLIGTVSADVRAELEKWSGGGYGSL